jgi:hypothetical protein
MEEKLIQRRSFWLRILFAIFALGTMALFLVPAYVIRPFHYQSPRALSMAVTLKGWAYLGTLVGAVVSALLAFALWPMTRRWTRAGLGVAMVLAAACATMSHLNYFEWMFHPLPKPGFEAADHSKLNSSEMVLALNFNHDARAYPISEMAYHHIVNDVVGGVPVAVTY